MTAPPISNELVDWAHLCGFAVTPNSVTEAALFASEPGGETRCYIRAAPNGGFTLTSTDRASAEQFELHATSMPTMERYLMGLFGYGYRSKHRLQRLRPLRDLNELAAGYKIVPGDPDGYWELFNRSGELMARALGKVSSISTFVRLSHLLESSLSDIRRSYESSDGSPLFTVVPTDGTASRRPSVARE
ncbi:Imm61 family immunity protein [Mycobacterium sp. SMC-4]|uniref:Imm61 family immunity protein n=1 Tax=Mycobacterium sp. SMC-4 TaxID=2857059 RepID=UPI003D035006